MPPDNHRPPHVLALALPRGHPAPSGLGDWGGRGSGGGAGPSSSRNPAWPSHPQHTSQEGSGAELCPCRAGPGRAAPGRPRPQAHGRLHGARPPGTVGRNTHLQTLRGKMRSLFLRVEFGGRAHHRPARLRLPCVMPVKVAGATGGWGTAPLRGLVGQLAPPPGKDNTEICFLGNSPISSVKASSAESLLGQPAAPWPARGV